MLGLTLMLMLRCFPHSMLSILAILLTVWKHSEREREENGGEKEGYGEMQKEE